MKKLLLVLLSIFILSVPAFGYGLGGAQPLIFIYSGGTGYGRSASEFPEHRWGYTFSYHNLSLTGDTLFGNMRSVIKFEGRDEDAEIGYLQIAFKGEGYEFVLGDNYAHLSDITLPYLGYQGLYLKSSFLPNLDLIILGGTRGSKLWGEKVRHETRDLQTFNGFKAIVYPIPQLNVNATFLSSNGGREIIAFGGGYDVNKNITLLGECGSSGDSHAYTAGLKFNGGGFVLQGIYRDIEPDYETPVGILNYKGHQGFYLTSSYSPSRYLFFSGRLNKYANNLSGDPDTQNEDSYLSVRFLPLPSTNLTYSMWGNDRRGYTEGGIGAGSLIELRHSFDFITKNTIYGRLEPSRYINPDDSADDYEQSRSTYGVLIQLMGKLNLDIASETKDQLTISTDTHALTSSTIAGLYLSEYKLPMFPVTASLHARYRSDMQPDDTGLATIFGDLTLRYKPTPELSSYLILRYSEVQAEEVTQSSRNLTEVKFGLTYSFNTGVVLK